MPCNVKASVFFSSFNLSSSDNLPLGTGITTASLPPEIMVPYKASRFFSANSLSACYITDLIWSHPQRTDDFQEVVYSQLDYLPVYDIRMGDRAHCVRESRISIVPHYSFYTAKTEANSVVLRGSYARIANIWAQNLTLCFARVT